LHHPVLDYYRCPDMFPEFSVACGLSTAPGYFRFREANCFGRWSGTGSPPSMRPSQDAWELADAERGKVTLPFDLSEVITNLRLERYARASHRPTWLARMIREVYYLLRPVMRVSFRKHLQRLRLRGWQEIAFPQWPVDLCVDNLMRIAMELALRSGSVDRIPFVWFWPGGAPTATIVTHDVEGSAGLRFCDELMDIDDSFGAKSAFQLVPEFRYTNHGSFEHIRNRGFEANLHDLNHDGHLFDSREEFLARAERISGYAREFDSRGFRTAGMYREQDWFDALDISYDMSVPNVAHMEPQRGGCCTVMPYFNGRILELPLTTVQDYSLFHILGDYSTTLWKQQMELIESRNGLITILTHPDYLIERRARAVYCELLDYIRQLQEQSRTWVALPGDVDAWWRSRNEMRIVGDGGAWRIEGPDAERARLAFAELRDGRLQYRLEPAA
jgi:hypothetical protein